MSAAEQEFTREQLVEAVQAEPGLARQLLLNLQAKRLLGEAVAALPTHVSPQAAQRAQATENVWRSIEQEFGLLSSSDVAERVGKVGRSYAHDRRKVGQLLAVKRGGHYFYPGFQLDASGPVPVIKSLADEAKRLAVREETVLLWLVTPATWWDGIGPVGANRPVDHLDDPEQISKAFASTFQTDW